MVLGVLVLASRCGGVAVLCCPPNDEQAVTEKQWQSQVVDLARLTGWRVYHTFDSRRSQPGYPDLTLVKDRAVFLELKTEEGKLSAAQKDWLAALLDAGTETYVARPEDFDDLAKVLSAPSKLRVLASMAHPNGAAARAASERLHTRTLKEVAA